MTSLEAWCATNTFPPSFVCIHSGICHTIKWCPMSNTYRFSTTWDENCYSSAWCFISYLVVCLLPLWIEKWLHTLPTEYVSSQEMDVVCVCVLFLCNNCTEVSSALDLQFSEKHSVLAILPMTLMHIFNQAFFKKVLALIPKKLCWRIKQDAPWALDLCMHVISLVHRFQKVMWLER